MKILFAAAAALTLSSSAYAYQTYTTTAAPVVVSVDPNAVFVPPATWTAEQRMLWDQHMAAYPMGWTDEQRAAFDALMGIPPASWTPEQRMLYEEHIAYLPPTWTDAQRTAYETQIAQYRTPWMTTQTASTDTTTTTLASNLPSVVQPSNASPEHDARGIPVISDVAYVPPGFNSIAGGAMGGPTEGTDNAYPPCTRERTDNCTQTYEVGRHPR